MFTHTHTQEYINISVFLIVLIQDRLESKYDATKCFGNENDLHFLTSQSDIVIARLGEWENVHKKLEEFAQTTFYPMELFPPNYFMKEINSKIYEEHCITPNSTFK